MQNTKDTFYEVLRDRVVAGNPERTTVVRGVVRPAVIVAENELVTAGGMLDCFRLRWISVRVAADGLTELDCEIAYATAGADEELSRGRAMTAMDCELRAALAASPQNTVKKDFSGLASGGAVVTMGSNVWWSDGEFGALTYDRDSLRRTVTVRVWSYAEAGEA